MDRRSTRIILLEIDLWANAAVYLASSGSSWNFESPNPRAITISREFTNPKRAASGLRGLSGIFSDAIFEEKLLVGALPKLISDMYREIEACHQAYWDYADGLAAEKPDFNERMYREMTSQASMMHLEFLKPIFEKLGIHPQSIHYHDDLSNMSYHPRVDSLDEVAGLISRGYYDGTHIPTIHAVFNGSAIVIKLPSWDDGANASSPAMQINNGSQEHTLESILFQARSKL